MLNQQSDFTLIRTSQGLLRDITHGMVRGVMSHHYQIREMDQTQSGISRESEVRNV